MISDTALAKARQYKKEMDAAYVVLKRSPSLYNASEWTSAMKRYNDFCVKIITDLFEDEENKKAEILANIDKYKKCNHCGTQLLYPIDAHNFIDSSDFLADFPGWCYSCLLEHCAKHECETCKLTNPAKCTFSEVKKTQTDVVQLMSADGYLLTDYEGLLLTTKTIKEN